jgi:DNA-binding transcriptional MerR regulator
MLTISELAKQVGISRSTLLYYERQGLLLPSSRAANGYRLYAEKQEEQLQQIVSYRRLGIPVAEIKVLLGHGADSSRQKILQQQFLRLEQEIAALQKQQRAIVDMLETPELGEMTMVSKERWVEIMRTAGLNDDDMLNWHRQFEKMEPEGHEEFLQSLGIDQGEVSKIREMSRT